MDAMTTSCLLSLICQYKSPSSVNKNGGPFVVLLIWREATMVVEAGLAACALRTFSWEAMVMASTGGGT
uniref:Uncharacterized protein n=1 Tax=Romanomermis culicivorax TaxID=13658 RepID=A0A915J182_ROMCU